MLSCGKAASSKLPYVEPQILACDSHTSRKSAPFRARAKFEPLCGPLQPAIRFLRVLLPASPTASPMAPRRRKPFQRDATGHLPFWLEPFSSFGSPRLTRIPTTVHLCCAYGTCLASTPHGCWQRRPLPRRRGESSFDKYIVPGASDPTVTHCACPGRQPLVAQRVKVQPPTFRLLNVTRQRGALPSTTLPGNVRRTATRVALETVSKPFSENVPDANCSAKHRVLAIGERVTITQCKTGRETVRCRVHGQTSVP